MNALWACTIAPQVNQVDRVQLSAEHPQELLEFLASNIGTAG